MSLNIKIVISELQEHNVLQKEGHESGKVMYCFLFILQSSVADYSC